MLARLLAAFTAWRWDARIRWRALTGSEFIFIDAPQEVVERWADKADDAFVGWPELQDAVGYAQGERARREREANECFWRECEKE